MAGGRDYGVASLTELRQGIDKAVAGDRLNMFRAAFCSTDRRAGLQHAGILHYHAFHAKVRAATHNRAEVVRVANIFQRQYAIFGFCFRHPLGHGSTMTFFDQEADAAVVFGTRRLRQFGFVHYVVGLTVGRHPAQRLFKARSDALDKPGAYDGFRTALEQRLTGVLAVDAGLFRALTAQHFRIDKALTADAAVIFFYRRLIARSAGNGAPRGSIVTVKIIALAIVAFAIVAAAVSFIARRAAAAVNT